MQIRQFIDKLNHPSNTEARPEATKQIVQSFLRTKFLKSLDQTDLDQTITFQEVMDYLKKNRLIITSEIDSKNKNDEALLTELISKWVDTSKGDKASLKKRYKWRKFLTGKYPQLDKSYYHYTVLDLAAMMGDIQLIKYLINEGADVNIFISQGITPLMVACGEDTHSFPFFNDCIQELLTAGADCNMEDNNGYTALDRAVGKGNDITVKLLLENGAYVKKKNLDVAEERLRKKWYLSGPERTILNFLVEANHSEMKPALPVIRRVIDDATEYKLPKDIAGLIASYDTRSVELRYFKRAAKITQKDELIDKTMPTLKLS